MPQLLEESLGRDIAYTHGATQMLGYYVAPHGQVNLPGLVLVHDAFGLTENMMVTAQGLARLGFAVLAADVWGQRATPADESDIGAFIGSMAGNRNEWMGRMAAAHQTLIAQPECDAAQIGSLGYCFGGSTVLEYLRTGGQLKGAISIHGGLDLLEDDWSHSAAGSSVLLCTGSEDPLATTQMREELQASLDNKGIDWEVDLYSGTKHAFTNPNSAHSPMPDVVAYNRVSAERAANSVRRFLTEIFPARTFPPGKQPDLKIQL